MLEYICHHEGGQRTGARYCTLAALFQRGELVLIFDGLDEAGEALLLLRGRLLLGDSVRRNNMLC